MMIVVVPYNPSWPAVFKKFGGRLRESLGELALRIDHIGSTAVPGLAAKDVIDVQVTVTELKTSIEGRLNRVGLTRLAHITRDHMPPGSNLPHEQWEKWFFKSTDGARAANLHVRIAGRANQRYPLLFRDYLRVHPEIALAYAQTKLAIARLHADDIDAYYDIKDPVCDIIMGGAESWANRAAWTMGDSDF